MLTSGARKHEKLLARFLATHDDSRRQSQQGFERDPTHRGESHIPLTVQVSARQAAIDGLLPQRGLKDQKADGSCRGTAEPSGELGVRELACAGLQ